jgi:hypothetical protein
MTADDLRLLLQIILLPAAGCDQAGLPAWGAAAGRGGDVVHREAGAGEQPGDDGVRVPHLACSQLVAAPDRGGQ